MPSIHAETESKHVLHVCTSCRQPGEPRQPFYQRSGYKLLQALKQALQDSDLGDKVEIRSAECLSVCPRPCGIAIASSNSWTYLFGDQRPESSVEGILECLATYISKADGCMPRRERPDGLRGSIMGRVPPFGGTNAPV
ncbi:MAG: DUF1636 domain-containing protein [Myxococcota bacterium]|nr:DUF1636 domain-containing protein [Myxococcota bacterium]